MRPLKGPAFIPLDTGVDASRIGHVVRASFGPPIYSCAPAKFPYEAWDTKKDNSINADKALEWVRAWVPPSFSPLILLSLHRPLYIPGLPYSIGTARRDLDMAILCVAELSSLQASSACLQYIGILKGMAHCRVSACSMYFPMDIEEIGEPRLCTACQRELFRHVKSSELHGA